MRHQDISSLVEETYLVNSMWKLHFSYELLLCAPNLQNALLATGDDKSQVLVEINSCDGEVMVALLFCFKHVQYFCILVELKYFLAA